MLCTSEGKMKTCTLPGALHLHARDPTSGIWGGITYDLPPVDKKVDIVWATVRNCLVGILIHCSYLSIRKENHSPAVLRKIGHSTSLYNPGCFNPILGLVMGKRMRAGQEWTWQKRNRASPWRERRWKWRGSLFRREEGSQRGGKQREEGRRL